MQFVVLTIVLAVIVFLLVKSVQDARREQAGGRPGKSSSPVERVARPASRRPRPRPRQGARKPKKIDEEALGAHVAKLREALGAGLISADDAVGSILRQTDGALSEDAARKLLEQDDAA